MQIVYKPWSKSVPFQVEMVIQMPYILATLDCCITEPIKQTSGKIELVNFNQTAFTDAGT